MKIEAMDWTGVEDPYNPGMDFPTAWAIQNEMGDRLTHDPRCSSRPGWGMLCDCGAVLAEHKRRQTNDEAREGEHGNTSTEDRINV